MTPYQFVFLCASLETTNKVNKITVYLVYLTLKLLELKVIGLLAFATSIEPGQPAHPCILTRLYTVGCQISNIFLDIPEIDNGYFQK